MNKSKEIRELIRHSQLSLEDKNFWYDILDKIEKYPQIEKEIEICLKYVLDIIEEQPDKIKWLTDVFKRKIKAIKNLDKEEWENILKDEEKILSQ